MNRGADSNYYDRNRRDTSMDERDNNPWRDNAQGRDSFADRVGRDTFNDRGGRHTFSERGGRESFSDRRGRDTFVERGSRDTFADRGGRDTFTERGGREAFTESRSRDAFPVRGGRDVYSDRGGRDTFVERGGVDAFADRGSRDTFSDRGKRDVGRPSRWRDRDRWSPYEKNQSEHVNESRNSDSSAKDRYNEREGAKKHNVWDRNHHQADREEKGRRTDSRRPRGIERHLSSSRDNSSSVPRKPAEEDTESSEYSENGPTDTRSFNVEPDNLHNQPPNCTIMIRGLAQHITENDIRQDILQCTLMPKDIRLIRKKDTGSSRGFAFVEFNSVLEASRWMEMKQGVLMLQEQYRAVMHYSIPKDAPFTEKYLKCSQDWFCLKCGAHNFKRRDACFKCQSFRHELEGGEGSEEVTHHPTSTVLLRGLDVLTTEETVRTSIAPYTAISLENVNINIGLDSLTNTSRGLCYVHMNNINDATSLYTALINDPPTIDGRKVSVSYFRPGVWREPETPAFREYSLTDIPRLAEYSASLYASSVSEHSAYHQYYHQYYQNQLNQEGVITLPTQADSVNAAAALAQAAIQQAMAVKEIKKAYMDPNTSHIKQYLPQVMANRVSCIPLMNTPVAGTVYTKYNVPDVSTYVYDETSGYYYDALTGLYYDANTQYYYNPATQQFLYWDSELETYTPAAAKPTPEPVDKQEEVKKLGRPNDKVKVAKKIAKDMERWAKTMNQKKETSYKPTSSGWPASVQKSVGAADAGYAVLKHSNANISAAPAAAPEPQDDKAEDASGLVAAYGGGSDSDEDIEDVLQEERQHINWTTLACLLCKRQFANKETLVRHQERSDLHKQNLATWYKVRGLDPNDPQQRNKKYRDRAKERRLKFNEPNAPQRNRLKEKYLKARQDAESVSYEEPTKTGIGGDNVGNKMLQKMGWQEGMGLGKANQGRTTIIQTSQRVSSAGLGVKGGSYGVQPGETYKDCVKKMMFARYQELTDQEQDAAEC